MGATVNQLTRLNANLSKVPVVAVREAVAHVDTIARANGGVVVLGRARKRTRLGTVAKYDTDRGTIVRATVFGTPTGPWVWKTSGTKAHVIPRRGDMRKARYLAGGLDHPTRVAVRHPGTRGRGAWRVVDKRARAEVPGIIERAVHDVVAKVA